MKYLLLLLVLVGCSNHVELAEQYKLDLQYYQYSVSFANSTMFNEAFESCERTTVLRSECFTSLVQNLVEKGVNPPIEYCDEIQPDQKMDMTKKAFKLVYDEIDDDLENEIKEKLNPSKQRIEVLTKIKGSCK